MNEAGNARRRVAARRVALLYAVAATMWILASDMLLFGEPEHADWAAALSTAKGVAFVGVTALLLYVLLSRLPQASVLAAAESALEESTRRLRTIVERIPIGMIVVRGDATTGEMANRAFTEITGYTSNEVPTFERAIELMIPDPVIRAQVAARARRLVEESRRTGRPAGPDRGKVRRRDGEVRDVEVHYVDLDGFGIWTFHDVTARARAEERVLQLSMLRDALGATNRAIVREKDEQALYRKVCEIAVQRAGFLGAWISAPDPATGAVIALASAGEETEMLREVQLSVRADEPERGGASGTALREERTVVLRNLDESSHRVGLATARRRGIRSIAAFPIRRASRVACALSVYSRDPDPFNHEVLGLLEEMASDVSFALEAIAAEKALRESEERFRAVLDYSIAAVYVIQDARLVYVNPRMREIFGYRPEERFDPDPLAHIAPADRPEVAEQMQRRLNVEPETAYSVTAVRKDGAEFTLGVHAVHASYQGRPAIIAIAQDITEKARAEEEIKRYIARLERAMRSTIEVVSTIGELRDPYTHGHERRVGALAAAIGAEIGLEAERVEGLRVAGYIHDVGKISAPAEILSKPARLSKAEFDLVKGHAVQGFEILKAFEFPWPVALVARQHHERLDGSGYPQGLKGEEIILEARIMAVADVLEAMASHRPYRPSLGLEAALAEIEKGCGALYDAQAADACLRLFRAKGYRLPA